MQAAAETFSIDVPEGSYCHGLAAKVNSRIYGPIESGVLLLESEGDLIVMLTSHFLTHFYGLSNFYRRRVADALGIEFDRIMVFSSHNHCCGKLLKHLPGIWGVDNEESMIEEEELSEEGRQLLHRYVETAKRLQGQLEEVRIAYGTGHERRITHNRKGRRADGSTYLMREEDRLLQGVDFNGDIDDDVFVVGFYGRNGKPVCFLTQFTGHPVTAYHPEEPVIHGEFPQVAGEVLSAAHDRVPVLFLQGCAGDVNCKGLLSGKGEDERAADADRYGHMLGETFVQLAGEMTSSSTAGEVSLQWARVRLPYKNPPSESSLRKSLERVEAFIGRCEAGDDAGTRTCDGLNFPSNLTPAYRKALVEPTQKWLHWALGFHEPGNEAKPPGGVSLKIGVLRIGDVGIVGLPCEPLLGIGRKMKELSSLPVTIPCGYMNDTRKVGYVPDGPNCEDLDYVSSFYRYTQSMLPYRKPAGDALARAAAKLLNQGYHNAKQ